MVRTTDGIDIPKHPSFTCQQTNVWRKNEYDIILNETFTIIIESLAWKLIEVDNSVILYKNLDYQVYGND